MNPVTTPLPNAPDFKLYCFYGIGTPTERGYHYLKTRKNGVIEWSINNMVNDPASGLVRVELGAAMGCLIAYPSQPLGVGTSLCGCTSCFGWISLSTT